MERKKVLILTQALPALGGTGMAMRIGSMVEVLAEEFDVTLVCVTPDEPVTEASLSPYFRSRCKELIFANVSTQAIPLRVSSGRPVKRILSNKPRQLAAWPLQATLDRLGTLAGAKFDAVLVSALVMMPLWQSLRARILNSACLTVLDLNDIESRSYKRQIKMLGVAYFGKIQYMIERLEVGKLRREESRAFRAVDKILLCSDIDKTVLSQRCRASQIGVVPNTIRLPDPMPPKRRTGRLSLLFVGTLNYWPNEDAVKWLSAEILPVIASRMGQDRCSLTVVGRDAPKWMHDASSRGVFALHENVASVEPFYSACDLVVAPIRAGGGTRIKILEAFGYGRAVVSTIIGAEGIEAIPGEEILIANTPTEFADVIQRVIVDEWYLTKVAQGGRKKAETHYSLSACGRAMGEIFQYA